MSTSDLHHMHTHKCTLKYIHTHFHTHAHTHAKNHMITLYGGIIQLRAMHTVCKLCSVLFLHAMVCISVLCLPLT